MKAGFGVQVTLTGTSFQRKWTYFRKCVSVVREMPRIGKACVLVTGRQQCKVKIRCDL